ncbi:MAG: GtrA family protein [Acidobacteriota bacterium]|nr:GtrA family protein [Acidobacteriota bacterium]
MTTLTPETHETAEEQATPARTSAQTHRMDAVSATEPHHHHHSLLSDDTPPDPQAHGPFAALRRMLPTGEVIRFLMVGGFNTVFALVLYSGFVILFARLLPHRGKPLIAEISTIVSQPIGITVAFLCYKHFVFKTKGNYLKEWLRCFAVYSAAFPATLVIVPVATKFLLLFKMLPPNAPPILAGILNSALIACYSYFAHKKFSFKR